jgi:hypothetical protein
MEAGRVSRLEGEFAAELGERRVDVRELGISTEEE